MIPATAPPGDHVSLSRLLARLLYLLRQETLDGVTDSGYTDLRPPHVHVLGNMRAQGIRLTELARRCQLSLGTTSVFVTELEDLGYLEREPDPDDRRAKRITFTEKGRRLQADARERLSQIERHWAGLIGERSYELARGSLQALLDRLTEEARNPPAGTPATPTVTRNAHP
jgi:DNA-binding MarR family transcriptional regulator